MKARLIMLSTLCAMVAAALMPQLLVRAPTASAEVAVVPNATSTAVGNCTKTILQADLNAGTVQLPPTGVVCLGSDVIWGAVGPALHIGASTLTLDMAGYTLFCTLTTTEFPAETIGIQISGGYDLKIRNGTIQGCSVGIDNAPGYNVIIRDMLIAAGSIPHSVGIRVSGNSNFVVVQDNFIQDYNVGLQDVAEGSIFVKDNVIGDILSFEGLPGYGMDFFAFTGHAIVERNLLIDFPGSASTGINYSANALDYTHLMMRNNAFLGFTTAWNVPNQSRISGYQNDSF